MKFRRLICKQQGDGLQTLLPTVHVVAFQPQELGGFIVGRAVCGSVAVSNSESKQEVKALANQPTSTIPGSWCNLRLGFGPGFGAASFRANAARQDEPPAPLGARCTCRHRGGERVLARVALSSLGAACC